MPIFGAHMSISGGYHRAVERAREAGCDCVQLFTKNNNQWRAKELTDEDAARFQDALARWEVCCPLAHDSYLINLASPDEALWRKSVEAFRVELERAAKLGIPWVVAHPGSYTTGSEQEGLERVIRALDTVYGKSPELRTGTLLENTAGQGTNLGWRFEHLAAIIAGARYRERLGVCIDTCHAFAAGYAMETPEEYRSTMVELDRVIGLGRVKAIHVNDSKKPLGSRVDRHEHIGRGHLGRDAFRHLVNDRRFAGTPMYLETAKEHEEGEDMDVVNLRVLRGLVIKRQRKSDARPKQSRSSLARRAHQ